MNFGFLLHSSLEAQYMQYFSLSSHSMLGCGSGAPTAYAWEENCSSELLFNINTFDVDMYQSHQHHHWFYRYGRIWSSRTSYIPNFWYSRHVSPKRHNIGWGPHKACLEVIICTLLLLHADNCTTITALFARFFAVDQHPGTVVDTFSFRGGPVCTVLVIVFASWFHQFH